MDCACVSRSEGGNTLGFRVAETPMPWSPGRDSSAVQEPFDGGFDRRVGRLNGNKWDDGHSRRFSTSTQHDTSNGIYDVCLEGEACLVPTPVVVHAYTIHNILIRFRGLRDLLSRGIDSSNHLVISTILTGIGCSFLRGLGPLMKKSSIMCVLDALKLTITRKPRHLGPPSRYLHPTWRLYKGMWNSQIGGRGGESNFDQCYRSEPMITW